MTYVRCTVRGEDVEDAMDVLLPLLPQGVHERPAAGGRTRLWWSGDRRLEAELGPLAADWEVGDVERRRPALVVAGRLSVRAGDAGPGPPGVPEILIEAARGQFGTGAHPTTRDSLELLASLPAGGSFADLGCGIGVLAVAAARLGFAPVTAVDVEPASARAAAGNAAANGLAVEATVADLLREPPPDATTVAANVPLAVHRALAPRLRPGTRAVIASGVVLGEADETIAAYAGFRVQARRDSDGWVTILLVRA